MRHLEVVYSPLCEASGAFVGKLRAWLAGSDIQLTIMPYEVYAQRHDVSAYRAENCFIDVYDGEMLLDSVPLHREKLCAVLGIPPAPEPPASEPQLSHPMSVENYRALRAAGRVEFLPITSENFREEMQMCLCNYPFGNPPEAFHADCMHIKSRVFEEVWRSEALAGVYARLNGVVIGLLEAFPREIVRRHGYMTGHGGLDADYLTVSCYEVGYGVPREAMLGDLMAQLLRRSARFHRRMLEGIGVPGCREGFNPYWVYEQNGFHVSESLSDTAFVMERALSEP